MNGTKKLPYSWYFLGIGGAGMNPLAQHLYRRGYVVAGYDRSRSSTCKQLEELGIHIDYLPQEIDFLTDGWGIVYSPAVASDHPVFAQASSLGLPLFKRAELLGLLSRPYRVIAIAGTHGKTTTSAMLTHLLISLGFSVTAFIGGYSLDLNGFYVDGTSDWWIVEADEFDRSFLQLEPELAAITSIDLDHLDTYRTEAGLLEGFGAFANKIKRNGLLVLHDSVSECLNNYISVKRLTYSLSNKSKIQSKFLNYNLYNQKFDWIGQRNFLRQANLAVPGTHNLENITAALALAEEVCIREGKSFESDLLISAIQSYRGVRRRWEVVVDSEKLVVVFDYAHHPKEIQAAISTAKTLYPEWQVDVVFQPHLFSRTQQLAAEFARSLSAADHLYLTHIYPAREEPIPGVTCEIITPFLRKDLPYSILNLSQVIEAVALVSPRPRVILLLGAGDIDQLIPNITSLFS